VQLSVALLAAQVAAAAVDLALPPDLSRARESSPVALDRSGAWLRALPVENGRWRIRADLSRTDPAFLSRLIATEDARFRWHPGVDPLALGRALATNAVNGRTVSGGSTLTMQTARLLEPRPRTLLAKAVEALRAVQLEARFSKDEILALYLTLAPYGGNLEGVRAASLAYFGHEPESLTPAEQALLVALPQAPEARRPDRRAATALAARDALLTRWGATEALNDPAPPPRSAFPSLAWHAAGEAARAAPLAQASVVTTLDANLQARLERLAAATAAAQGPDASVAVLVVETRSRAVRAAVGSAGLAAPGGWIDMTRAVRSPGSALKPFIYGLAFEQGLAAPDTLLDDAPARFRDYQPENFDRTFHGRVTAREALAHSLNVPAVATLDRLGPAAFEARLAAAGVRLERPKARSRDAGLALALGGAGLTLRDLAVLYAALADGGRAKPLVWTEVEAAAAVRRPGVRLLRAEAARQVVDILRETPPPGGRAPGALTRTVPVAYKTGTSYGFRDAVAAGLAGPFVVVVWTGRPDGGARTGLTGRDAAAPLLFDVVDALNAPASAPRPLAPRRAPQALASLDDDRAGPKLIFPPDGAVVQVDGVGGAGRGLVLAARGQDLRWFAEGEPLAPDPVTGKTVWRPAAPGFHRLSVVDGAGREARAKVRVRLD
jgi:penicillin-binding protein 1C